MRLILLAVLAVIVLWAAAGTAAIRTKEGAMLRIRRLYFYLVLYVSLSMLLVGVATLVRVLLEQLLGVTSSGIGFEIFQGREQFREQTALGIALAALGLPVWLLHWRTVQGWLAGPEGADDRASALRRLYLYAVLLTTALTAYWAGRDLLVHLMGLPLGLVSGSEQIAGLARPLPYLLAAGLFWAYHWQVAAADRAAAGETGASATLRRWYLYLMIVVGVGPLAAGLAMVGATAWELAFDRGGLAAADPPLGLRTMVEHSATALAALVVWLAHRSWSQAAVATTSWYGENERHSVLRRVHLYGLVLWTVAMALTFAAELVRFAISSALGVAPDVVGGRPVPVALGLPLASVVVFGTFWAFFWRAVSAEAAAQREVGRQAGVRRLYFYLVSAVALAFVAISTAGLLRLLADALLQPPAVDPSGPRAALALQASWLVIGLPVWLVHWSRSQALARGSRGDAETRSLTRRWYLYAVAFAAVAVMLFSGARVIYELVLAALGRPADRALVGNLSHAVVGGLVAGAVLWYHWWHVLRADLAAVRQAARQRAAVAVIAGLDASGVAMLQQFVRQSLDGARARIYWADEASAHETVGRALTEQPDGK
jgi:hypothetical protein